MSPEETIVYRSYDGRRFFTKKAALMSDVMFALKQRHEMYDIRDSLYGGEHIQSIHYSDERWRYFRNVAHRAYR